MKRLFHLFAIGFPAWRRGRSLSAITPYPAEDLPKVTTHLDQSNAIAIYDNHAQLPTTTMLTPWLRRPAKRRLQLRDDNPGSSPPLVSLQLSR